jgi:xanthine dehydrogenase accessory factor
VIAAWPEAALSRIDRIDGATYIAVLTHDPQARLRRTQGRAGQRRAVRRGVGSRRAQAERHQRLLDSGVPQQALARIAGPIGLDIGATSPEETAISILAEMIAVRNGRPGGRLARATCRVHPVPA